MKKLESSIRAINAKREESVAMLRLIIQPLRDMADNTEILVAFIDTTAHLDLDELGVLLRKVDDAAAVLDSLEPAGCVRVL